RLPLAVSALQIQPYGANDILVVTQGANNDDSGVIDRYTLSGLDIDPAPESPAQTYTSGASGNDLFGTGLAITGTTIYASAQIAGSDVVQVIDGATGAHS